MFKHWLCFALISACYLINVESLNCTNVKCADYKTLKCNECINNPKDFKKSFEQFYTRIWTRRLVFLQRTDTFINLLAVTDNTTSLKNQVANLRNVTSREGDHYKKNFADILDFNNTDSAECFCSNKIKKISKLGKFMHSKIKPVEEVLVTGNFSKDSTVKYERDITDLQDEELVTKAVEATLSKSLIETTGAPAVENKNLTETKVLEKEVASLILKPVVENAEAQKLIDMIKSLEEKLAKTINSGGLNQNVTSNVTGLVQTTPKIDQMTTKIDQTTPKSDQSKIIDQTTPKINQLTPTIDKTTPKIDQLTPKNDQLTSKNDQTTPKIDQTTPKIDQLTSKIDQTTPKINPLTPRIDQTTPTIDQLTPKIDQTTPKIDQTTPKIDQTTPKIDQLTPRIDQTTPKIDQTTPKIDQLTPRIDQTTPKIDQTTPKIDQTTPKIDRNTQKSDQTTPRIDLETPKIDQVIPKIDQTTPKTDKTSIIDKTPTIDSTTEIIDQTTPIIDEITSTEEDPYKSQREAYKQYVLSQMKKKAKQKALTENFKKLIQYYNNLQKQQDIVENIKTNENEVINENNLAEEVMKSLENLNVNLTDFKLIEPLGELLRKTHQKLENLSDLAITSLIQSLKATSELLMDKTIMNSTVKNLQNLGVQLKDPKLEESLRGKFKNFDNDLDEFFGIITDFGKQLKQLEKNPTIRNQLVSLGTPENTEKIFTTISNVGDYLKNLRNNAEIKSKIDGLKSDEVIELFFEKMRVFGDELKVLEEDEVARNKFKKIASDQNLDKFVEMIKNFGGAINNLVTNEGIRSDLKGLSDDGKFGTNLLVLKNLGEQLKGLKKKDVKDTLKNWVGSSNVNEAFGIIKNFGEKLSELEPNENLANFLKILGGNVDNIFEFCKKLGEEIKKLVDNDNLKNQLKKWFSDENFDVAFKLMGFLGEKLRNLEANEDLKGQLKTIAEQLEENLEKTVQFGDQLKMIVANETLKAELRKYSSPENVDKVLKMLALAGENLVNPEVMKKIKGDIKVLMTKEIFEKGVQQIKDFGDKLINVKPEEIIKEQTKIRVVLENVDASLKFLRNLGNQLNDPALADSLRLKINELKEELGNPFRVIQHFGETLQNFAQNKTIKDQILVWGKKQMEDLELLFSNLTILGDYLKTIHENDDLRNQINALGSDEGIQNFFKKIHDFGEQIKTAAIDGSNPDKIKSLVSDDGLEKISKILVGLGNQLKEWDDPKLRAQLKSLGNITNFDDNVKLIRNLGAQLKNLKKGDDVVKKLEFLGAENVDKALIMFRNFGEELNKLQGDQKLKSTLQLLHSNENVDITVKYLSNLGEQLLGIVKNPGLIKNLVTENNLEITLRVFAFLGEQLKNLEATQDLKSALKDVSGKLGGYFKFVAKFGDDLKKLGQNQEFKEQLKSLSSPEMINKALEGIGNLGKELRNEDLQKNFWNQVTLGKEHLETQLEIIKSLGNEFIKLPVEDVLDHEIKVEALRKNLDILQNLKPEQLVKAHLKTLANSGLVENAVDFVANLGEQLQIPDENLKTLLKMFIGEENLGNYLDFAQNLGERLKNLKNQNLKEGLRNAISEGNLEKAGKFIDDITKNLTKPIIVVPKNLDSLENLEKIQDILTILMAPYKDLKKSNPQVNHLKGIVSQVVMEAQPGLIAGLIENKVRDLTQKIEEQKLINTKNQEVITILLSNDAKNTGVIQKLQEDLTKIKSNPAFEDQLNQIRSLESKQPKKNDILSSKIEDLFNIEDLTNLNTQKKGAMTLFNIQNPIVNLEQKFEGKPSFETQNVADFIKKVTNPSDINQLKINNQVFENVNKKEKIQTRVDDLENANADNLIEVAKKSATSGLDILFKLQDVISDDVDKEYEMVKLLSKLKKTRQYNKAAIGLINDKLNV